MWQSQAQDAVAPSQQPPQPQQAAGAPGGALQPATSLVPMPYNSMAQIISLSHRNPLPGIVRRVFEVTDNSTPSTSGAAGAQYPAPGGFVNARAASFGAAMPGGAGLAGLAGLAAAANLGMAAEKASQHHLLQAFTPGNDAFMAAAAAAAAAGGFPSTSGNSSDVSALSWGAFNQAAAVQAQINSFQNAALATGAAAEVLKQHTKRRAEDDRRDGSPHDEEAQMAMKRPRLIWTSQLHERFVQAVNKMGVDQAVPKAIMQSMNVKGITRENVASHLQKYRAQLKKGQAKAALEAEQAKQAADAKDTKDAKEKRAAEASAASAPPPHAKGEDAKPLAPEEKEKEVETEKAAKEAVRDKAAAAPTAKQGDQAAPSPAKQKKQTTAS